MTDKIQISCIERKMKKGIKLEPWEKNFYAVMKGAELSKDIDSKDRPHTIGFWKRGNRFLSSPLFKKNIPNYCRLTLVKNAFKNADKRPDYIGYLVPCKDGEKLLSVKRPLSVLRKQTKEESQDFEYGDFVELLEEHQDWLEDYLKGMY